VFVLSILAGMVVFEWIEHTRSSARDTQANGADA